MGATFTIPLQSVIPGQLITSSLWNNEFTNISDNFTPAGMDDYSSTDGEMQTQTAPYPGSVLSKPTALSGELERLRYQMDAVIGQTYWYEAPSVDLEQLSTHDHSDYGATVVTAGITDLAVTNAKLGADAVDGAKIADDSIDSEHYVDGSIDNAHLAADCVNGAKIADDSIDSEHYVDGSIDTAHIGNLQVTEGKIAALAVTNGKIGADAVNGAKIADDAIDSEHYAAGSIDEEHLSTAVRNLMSPKSINRYSKAITVSLGSDSSATVQGSGNQTVTSVDTSKSVVVLNGCRITAQSNVDVHTVVASARLTSATNVACVVSVAPGSNPGNNTITVTVDFEVLEFN